MDTAQYITFHYIGTVSEAHLQNWSANVLAFESISVVIMEAVRNLKERDTEENRIERLAHGDLFIQHINSCRVTPYQCAQEKIQTMFSSRSILCYTVQCTIQYNTTQYNTTQHQH